MASLWFTWTYDARTAGMGAFQRDRRQNNSNMSNSDLAPTVDTSPGSVMTKSDHGTTGADQPVTVRPNAAVVSDEPVTDRTDPILAREDPVTGQTDPVEERDELLTPTNEPVLVKSEPVRTRSDPIMVKGETVMTRPEPVVSKCEPVRTVPVCARTRTSSSKTKTVTPRTEQSRTTSTARNDAAMTREDAMRASGDPTADAATDRMGTGLDSLNVTKRVTHTTSSGDDAMAEAVTFLGLLRHKEDELAERTRQLMKRDRRLVQLLFSTTVEGWTPLHACTLRGARKLVKMALKCGVSPDLEMGQPEGLPAHCSPLHLAAHRGDVSLLQVLVQAGASVSKRDGAHRTPLFYAASNNNTLAARKLIKYGADLSDLSPQQIGLYREDIERRSTSFSCIPVQGAPACL